MKHQEIGRNKEKKTKKLRKKKPKTQQNRHDFVAVLLAIFDFKLGIAKDFSHLCAHQSRLQPRKYQNTAICGPNCFTAASGEVLVRVGVGLLGGDTHTDRFYVGYRAVPDHTGSSMPSLGSKTIQRPSFVNPCSARR